MKRETRSNEAPLRLYLVRHGEAIANRDMRYLGSRDDPLTEHGVWQAQQLARSLASIPITAIYASPLKRSVETAEPIAAALHLQLVRDDRLREASFGEWEGLTRAEVINRSPQDAAMLSQWESDPTCAPPHGDSFQHIQARVLDLVETLKDLHGGESVVLVSHVGPIKAILAAALGVGMKTVHRCFLDPATISVIDWGSLPLLRLFNAHQPSGWDSARWMKTNQG